MTILQVIRTWMSNCEDLNREVKIHIITRDDKQMVIAKDVVPLDHVHMHSGTICIESAEIAKLDESEWYK